MLASENTVVRYVSTTYSHSRMVSCRNISRLAELKMCITARRFSRAVWNATEKHSSMEEMVGYCRISSSVCSVTISPSREGIS